MLKTLKNWASLDKSGLITKLFETFQVEKWKAKLNGRPVERKRLRFEPTEILWERALAFSVTFSDVVNGVATDNLLIAVTNFKNNGSDVIRVNRAEMRNAGLDLDIKMSGLNVVAQIEFRYTDEQGADQLFVIYTSLGFLGLGARKLFS